MATLINYVQNIGHLTFEQQPLNELDIAALTEIVYLPVDDIFYENISITHLSLLYNQIQDKFKDNWILSRKERIQLLETMAQSPRFQAIHCQNFVNEIDENQEKQFSAMTLTYQNDYQFIIYRGTDDTIVGWKEDFNMAVSQKVPAQQSALNYLVNYFNTDYSYHIVSGHSKGGNLALYAATMVETTIQQQINKIYIFDAPGLQDNIVKLSQYQRIKLRTYVYLPQDSLVGILMTKNLPMSIVYSRAIGINQHYMMTWQVNQFTFERKKALSATSQIMKITIQQWLNQLPDEQLERFFNVLFEVFDNSQVSTLNDLSAKFFKNASKLISSIKDMTPEDQQLVQDFINLLSSTYYDNGKKYVNDYFKQSTERLTSATLRRPYIKLIKKEENDEV